MGAQADGGGDEGDQGLRGGTSAPTHVGAQPFHLAAALGRLRDRHLGAVLLLPSGVLFLALLAFPLGYGVYTSFFDVHLLAVGFDEFLEQGMRFLQFLLQLLPVLGPVFSEQCQVAFVFAGGDLFKIDVVLFQEAVKG